MTNTLWAPPSSARDDGVVMSPTGRPADIDRADAEWVRINLERLLGTEVLHARCGGQVDPDNGARHAWLTLVVPHRGATVEVTVAWNVHHGDSDWTVHLGPIDDDSVDVGAVDVGAVDVGAVDVGAAARRGSGRLGPATLARHALAALDGRCAP